jgi:hypothetical protein
VVTPLASLCLFAECGKGRFRTAHMQIALPYVSFKKFLKIGNGVFNLIHGVPPQLSLWQPSKQRDHAETNRRNHHL